MTTLPDKPLLRLAEVAAYFDVTERTIRLWVEHKHLQAEKLGGVVRITRESVVEFRLKSRVD